MKSILRSIYTAAFCAIFFAACKKQDQEIPAQTKASGIPSTVATDWMTTLQKIVQSEGASPPVASRIYAYSSIGLYQSVLPGMESYQSLEGQVPGLNQLPDYRTYGQLDLEASANEAMYQVAKQIFVAIKPENLKTIEDLHTKYFMQAFNRSLSHKVYNSVAFGKAAATAVLRRAANDNFSTTRGLNYVIPSSTNNPSYWSPTVAGGSPIEPHWGQLQCFAMPNGSACTIPSTIPFSTTPGSAFYNAANEVYNTSLGLTTDQKNIANWWADGPGQTATPPGHWLSIISQLAVRNNYDLEKVAECYTSSSIGMADAFISCWNEKYRFNLLRPENYIQKYLPGQANWKPLLASPLFPEYPSGHSVASGAAATILTKLLGNIPFVDSANVYLGFPPRSFTSFNEAANEAAISRLYGGIHFREAIESGLTQGKEVSKAFFEKIHLRK